MRTLLGAGARAIHPLAWLAGSSSLGLPNTNLLLMAAERRLLFMHMALSSPSNQDPDGCAMPVKQLDVQGSMCNCLFWLIDVIWCKARLCWGKVLDLIAFRLLVQASWRHLRVTSSQKSTRSLCLAKTWWPVCR